MGVARDVGAQVAGGDWHILGVMIESNLVEGSQPEPLKNTRSRPPNDPPPPPKARRLVLTSGPAARTND